MDRIAVDRIDVALFVVVEDTVSPEGTGTNNVLYSVSLETNRVSRSTHSICQDVAVFSIDNETSCFA